MISNSRTNGIFLTYVFDAGKNALMEVLYRRCEMLTALGKPVVPEV